MHKEFSIAIPSLWPTRNGKNTNAGGCDWANRHLNTWSCFGLCQFKRSLRWNCRTVDARSKQRTTFAFLPKIVQLEKDQIKSAKSVKCLRWTYQCTGAEFFVWHSGDCMYIMYGRLFYSGTSGFWSIRSGPFFTCNHWRKRQHPWNDDIGRDCR